MASSLGSSSVSDDVRSVDQASGDTCSPTKKEPVSSRPVSKQTRMMPEIWKLVEPFKWVLAGGCLLMIVNRICSLAVPISAFIQAITTYILSQQLSIAGEQLIADLRMRVQQHIGRLPISFFDSNRAGALVTRIMTDVEGV